jgi:hypothetical protein
MLGLNYNSFTYYVTLPCHVQDPYQALSVYR